MSKNKTPPQFHSSQSNSTQSHSAQYHSSQYHSSRSQTVDGENDADQGSIRLMGRSMQQMAPLSQPPAELTPSYYCDESTLHKISATNPLHSGVFICLHKTDRIYHINDNISGHILLHVRDGWYQKGINLQVWGQVSMSIPETTTSLKNNSPNNPTNKPTNNPKSSLLIHYNNILLKSSGKIHLGSYQIPFAFPLIETNRTTLLESYIGTHINIVYTLKINIERTFFRPRPLERKMEFVVCKQKESLSKIKKSVIEQVHSQPPSCSDSTSVLSQTFQIISPQKEMSSDSSEQIQLPVYCLSGKVENVLPKCNIDAPITGEIFLEYTNAPLSSIEIQLLSIESVSKEIHDLNGAFLPSPFSPDLRAFRTTNIMRKFKRSVLRLEIAHGNIIPKIRIPIFMRFPQLKTCSTFISDFFSIEFEFIVKVSFENGHEATKIFPLSIFRA